MMRIKAMAAVKTLFLILFTKHIKAHTEYYLQASTLSQAYAKRYCTLATPEVHFTEVGYTVDLDDISYHEGDTILTGYSQMFHGFQYSGCNNLTRETYSNMFQSRGDIGMCNSACGTAYIGIGVNKTKITCYCYDTYPKLKTRNRCTVTCDGGKLCGGHGFVSIYKHVEKHVDQTEENTCLAYYPRFQVTEKEGTAWKDCNDKLRVTCQDEKYKPDSKGTFFTYESWTEAVKVCFEKNEYPITEELVSNAFALHQGRWTGQIRSQCLLANSSNPTGYLQRSTGSNSTFILKFGDSNQYGRPLCVKAQPWGTLATGGFRLFRFNISLFYMLFTSVFAVADFVVGEEAQKPIIDFVTDARKESTTDPSSSSGRTDVDTYSMTDREFIHKTDATQQSAFDHDDNETSGKGTDLDVIYIIIPVSVIAVGVIALLLLRRRNRKAATVRRDTEGYRQVSFRSNQRMRTVTNQVYAAEGFHQAPSDSVQNTYHILEPTYEQVDVVDQRIGQPGVVESPGDLDGKSSLNVAQQLSAGSASGQVNVNEQPNDRHSNEPSRDYHILEPTYEIPDVVESHEHLNGHSSIKVVCQLASGSSYEQVDVCAGANEQVDESTVQGGANKLEPVRNNVDPFDIYNHSSTTGADDYDTTASVIGKRQTTFPVTDDVYNRLGDADTYNILKKY